MLSDGRHARPGSGATVLGVLAEGDAPFYAVSETSKRGKGELAEQSRGRAVERTPRTFQGRSILFPIRTN